MIILEIRKGTSQDMKELSALYDDLNDYLEHHTNYPGWKKGVYPIGEDAELAIEENTLWVAVEDKRIVGTVILNCQPEAGYELADWHNSLEYKEIFVIHTLAVHPVFLKQGVGTKLMEFVLNHAIQMEKKAVRLDVYEKNDPAIHLYESMGFEYIDTVDLGYSMYNLNYFRLYQRLL